MMIAILCASEATATVDQQVLKALHDSCARRNRELGLTGYLGWKNERFFQYLEGPENAMDQVLACIGNDKNQRLLRVVRLGPIQRRRCSRWDMLTFSDDSKPDRRIHDLLEELTRPTGDNVLVDTESRQFIMDMLGQPPGPQMPGKGDLLHAESSDVDTDVTLSSSDTADTLSRFFRDPDAWDSLKESIQPLIDSEIVAGETFRVWVTACATGEEAYSIGMVMAELLENLDKRINFKIYATDIDREALKHASTGVYDERSLEHVSETRRQRFFSKKAGAYLIARHIRENVIFAPHDFIRNAPFTRMHLVTCRNALIGVQADVQQIALKRLHSALNVQGILFLGPSETLGKLEGEFCPVNREWNQYRKRRNLRLPLHFSVERMPTTTQAPNTGHQQFMLDNVETPGSESLTRVSLDAMAQYLGCTCLLVDGNRMVKMVIADPAGILHVHRDEPTLDVARMIPASLRPSMTFAISRAFRESIAVAHRQLRCRPTGQAERMVDIEVIPHLPLGDVAAHHALVIMSVSADSAAQPVDADIAIRGSDDHEVDQLRLELDETRKALQAAIIDLESSNKEQRLVNEQLSAANEVLQGTNEELQSVNEELYTVSVEYQTKLHELSDLNHDLASLLESTNLGVIFLDSELCIRRFTEVATQTINLLPSDVGRPLVDLAHNLHYEGLMSDLRRVLSIGKSITREIRRHNDDQLQMSIHPYRAGSGLAQGVLIVFRDIRKNSGTSQVSEDRDKVH